MTKDIGQLPRWQQIAIFAVALFGMLAAIDFAKTRFGDSREARAIKIKMEPLAERLEKAEKLGDKATALALAEPTVNIVNEYNSLDDARKEKINQLPLRNCVLAAVHLSSGPVEVLQTGYWASKSKYEAALGACK